MADSASGRRFFLVAGEPSGDALGGRLMAALDALSVEKIHYTGIGGKAMAAQDLESLFPIDELSIMGLFEVLPSLPRLIRRLNLTAATIRNQHPDAVITIDAPGFNFRLARRLKKNPRTKDIPIIHLVAPSVWAWRPGRAKEVAGFLDHLLALLPFEPPYFESQGLATTFIGHPVLESGAGEGDGAAFRARHAIAPDIPILILLPGSRAGEVGRLLPVFKETLDLLQKEMPGLHVVLPCVPALAETIEAETANWSLPVTCLSGEAEKFDAFAAGTVALAASGTVTTELAMAGLPMVVTYKMNPFTALLARHLVKVPYVTLVNLVLEKAAIPEFLQGDCQPDRLAGALMELVVNAKSRAAQIGAFSQALDRLGQGGETPSRKAARVILDVVASGFKR
ncbi:MAG: lipid-A-disaccharide synthase [Rhodospirillaceae bacterium]|jgi:lipid-A-disaccharide synthase|nr:lipid-A-disaccharide synthase [Rhodospirillaceae bacterium]MBT5752941.1 lipid-A-disaccharide synthase [Rhodospirillaceae bacterium]